MSTRYFKTVLINTSINIEDSPYHINIFHFKSREFLIIQIPYTFYKLFPKPTNRLIFDILFILVSYPLIHRYACLFCG